MTRSISPRTPAAIRQPRPRGAGEPSALRVLHRAVGFRRVLTAEGDIDMGTIGTLRSAIDSALDSWEREVWIDLGQVAFMDSSGLHVLVEAHRALAAHRRQLLVICPTGQVRRLLALAAVDRELSVLGSRADAQRLS